MGVPTRSQASPRAARRTAWLVAWASVAAGCRALDGATAPDSAAPAPAAAPIKSVALPSTDFFPTYRASPNRAQTAFGIVNAVDSEIEDAGDQRFLVRIGGPIGIVRFSPEGKPDQGFQVDIEIGFAGLFDAIESLDNIGWNGIFGFRGAYKPNPNIALHLGTLHNSSHVGDEYAERTGRQRIEYTREEVVAGASLWPNEYWRFYAEAGIGFGGEDFQEPLRIELGAEVEGEQSWWFEGIPWYAAVDLDAFQERDFVPAITAQLGITIQSPEETSQIRLAFEAYHGRSWIGEFSFDDETYVGFAVFYDF